MNIDGFNAEINTDEYGNGADYTVVSTGVLVAKGWIRTDHVEPTLRQSVALDQVTAIVKTLAQARVERAPGSSRATGSLSAQIETLRTFATAYANYITDSANREQFAAFVHMCTSALLGETWAFARIYATLEEIAGAPGLLGLDRRLEVIRLTDASRPDGAIARTIKI